MYLPIPPQPDCAAAWLAAFKAVDERPKHQAHNVIIDVLDPTAGATLQNEVVREVNKFLVAREKSIECIANTIFPQGLYEAFGMPTFIDKFHMDVLPKVKRSQSWSGYYFERITSPLIGGGNQLSRMIERMQDPKNKSLNKHELSLFDPERDVNGGPYGGQCLSFLSFHLLPGYPKRLLLTAQYRNHYYSEKLLGNLIGLGRLMKFVAKETGSTVGHLTVISTHAEIDQPNCVRGDIEILKSTCEALITTTDVAA